MSEWEDITPQRRSSDGWETVAPAAQPSLLRRAANTVGSNIAGTIETGMALGSGALAGPAAGIAGLAQGAKNLVSPGMSAGDRVRQVQERLTYEPSTAAGRTLTGAVAYPFEKLAQGADYVGGAAAEATGSPAIGAGINTALQAAPALLARGVRAPVQRALARSDAEATAMASRESVRDATLADARAEGYVVPPAVANRGGTIIGNRVEGIAGKAALSQEAQLRNQQVTNRIAREEAGLAVDSPISEATLKSSRDTMSAPYREVSALSTVAKTKLEQLQEARLESKDHWKHYDSGMGGPAARKEAQRYDAVAAQLENDIEAIAQSQGRSGLVTELREARKALAKNHDVERALNLGSGDVDARVIGRIYDKRGEGGMTGGLATIGRFTQAFQNLSREGAPLPTPGKGEGMAAAALGMGGHASGLGWLPMGLPLLAGPARSALLSQAMQTPRTYGPGAGISGLEALLRNPEALTVGGPVVGNNQGLSQLLQR